MEKYLITTAREFLIEIRKLENFRAGSNMSIRLAVRQKGYDNKVEIALEATFDDGSNYNTVKAASLGALMDEVHRRAGFTDKQTSALDRVENELLGLPSPE